MGRKTDLPTEVVDAAREVMKITKDAEELQGALSVVLSGVLGLTLPAVAALMGRSRATVVRLRKQFKEWYFGHEVRKKKGGGKHREYLTSEREQDFLAGFFDAASRGGVPVVSEVKKSLEEKLGHDVAETTVYRMLARHGWRKIVPRRKHPKNSKPVQEVFKKDSKTR